MTDRNEDEHVHTFTEHMRRTSDLRVRSVVSRLTAQRPVETFREFFPIPLPGLAPPAEMLQVVSAWMTERPDQCDPHSCCLRTCNHMCGTEHVPARLCGSAAILVRRFEGAVQRSP